MTPLEAILKEVDGLSASERAQLVDLLARKARCDAQADEVTTGQRGLAAWTESTRDESWSEFYSDSLPMSGDDPA